MYNLTEKDALERLKVDDSRQFLIVKSLLTSLLTPTG